LFVFGHFVFVFGNSGGQNLKIESVMSGCLQEKKGKDFFFSASH